VDSLLKAIGRFERQRRFLQDRFSPEGHLGLHLTVGLLVIVLFGWCFSEIAEMLGPGVPLIDQQLTGWFYQKNQPGLTRAALALTSLGSVGFLFAASFGVALILGLWRAWDRLLAFCLTMLGGSLLNIALKHFFHRQRPVLEDPLVTLTSFGFPSGHTMGATLFYGVIALIAARSIKSWRWRMLAFAVAFVVVALIGLTRIYLGAHYLTDVLAAVAAGAVWLAFAWTTIETFRKRRPRNRALECCADP